jgi:hypothetical protein
MPGHLGHVEQAVLADWPALCGRLGVTALEHPGRRTIYDASFEADGNLVGVDFRTKDLADDRYSDSGICAVANLLRFMVGNKATLLITELGYSIQDGVAVFTYIRTAPVHALPVDTYRIENLGTGQLRFNDSILECGDRVVWDRSIQEFFADFAPLCTEHYRRVKQRSP